MSSFAIISLTKIWLCGLALLYNKDYNLLRFDVNREGVLPFLATSKPS